MLDEVISTLLEPIFKLTKLLLKPKSGKSANLKWEGGLHVGRVWMGEGSDFSLFCADIINICSVRIHNHLFAG